MKTLDNSLKVARYALATALNPDLKTESSDWGPPPDDVMMMQAAVKLRMIGESK